MRASVFMDIGQPMEHIIAAQLCQAEPQVKSKMHRRNTYIGDVLSPKGFCSASPEVQAVVI